MKKKGTSNIFSAADFLVLLLLIFLISGCEQTPEKSTGQTEKKVYDGLIVAMGDSLTAGLGVSVQDSYPALLEKQLEDSGLNYQVINSGISGETSSGARSRVNWILTLKPDIVILETGANDGLRGIAPQLVKSNIKEIIETLLTHDVGVILAGMQMVTNLGADYLEEFNQLYPELAANHPVIFMPFFLKDVAAVPAMNQADGIHPNGQGYRLIAANLLPHVKTAITARRSQ